MAMKKTSPAMKARVVETIVLEALLKLRPSETGGVIPLTSLEGAATPGTGGVYVGLPRTSVVVGTPAGTPGGIELSSG